GQIPVPPPEAMSEDDIHAAIDGFARSAELAMRAGFDGVELHGANGYLIEQFLNTGANRRTDAWGGSVENRTRFAREGAKRVGAPRVGMRVSPYGASNGLVSDDERVEDVHESLASALSEIGLAYVHIVDHRALGAPEVKPSIKRKIREAFRGTLILAGGYDR